MKKLLLLSYFFPPLGGPGVQRIQKFVKYFPKNNWKPIVLTVKNISYIAYDETLKTEIADTVDDERLHAGIGRRLAFVPEPD